MGNLLLIYCLDSEIPIISNGIFEECKRKCSSSKCLVRLLMFTSGIMKNYEREIPYKLWVSHLSCDNLLEFIICTRFSSRSHEFKLGKLVSLEATSKVGNKSSCDGKSTSIKSHNSVL